MVASVRSSEVRKVARLLGEARELRTGRLAQKQHCAIGIAEIVGARVCALIDGEDFGANRRGRILEIVDTGWDSTVDQQRTWAMFGTHGTRFDVGLRAQMALFPMLQRSQVFMHRREELVSNEEWYGSFMVGDVWKAARLDHTIYGGLGTSVRGGVRGIGLKRTWGERTFSDEECALAELFVGRIDWLWSPDAAEVVGRLSPRQRDVLEALSRDVAPADGARHLGISALTFHDYVKSLYVAFGVHSRAELLARLAETELGGALRTQRRTIARKR